MKIHGLLGWKTALICYGYDYASLGFLHGRPRLHNSAECLSRFPIGIAFPSESIFGMRLRELPRKIQKAA